MTLFIAVMTLSSCGGDGENSEKGQETTGSETNVNINASNIDRYVSCSINNSFKYANGNCKWNVSVSVKSTLANTISPNRIRYGIVYGVLADLGEDFSERSLYSESAIALMKKMGSDALGEQYESAQAGNNFTISMSSTANGTKIDSEETSLLKSIKPYAVVAAIVEIDGKRFEIDRNSQKINI